MINKNVNHLIFGAGLIGSYLAGALLIKTQPVTLVGRDKTRQSLKGGILISDYSGNSNKVSSPIFIDADNRVSSIYNIVWLTIKSTSIKAAISSINNVVTKNTLIICCQNGLGGTEIISKAFPQNKVISAVVGYNVVEVNDGHFHRATDGQLIIQSDSSLDDLIESLNSPYLPMSTSTYIIGDQWAKLQLNLANAVNALSDIPIKTMTEDRNFRRIIALLMDEFLDVSRAKGIKLSKVTAIPGQWIPTILRLPNFLFKRIAQKMLAIDPLAKTSMWHDLSQGRPTEISFLNGALVSVAQQVNINCPINNALSELIHQVENGDEQIGIDSKTLIQRLTGNS